MAKRKRKADRVYFDKTGESNLPVRKTKEIAETHQKQLIDVPQQREAMKTLESNEIGKEMFDFVLKKMASPDK